MRFEIRDMTTGGEGMQLSVTECKKASMYVGGGVGWGGGCLIIPWWNGWLMEGKRLGGGGCSVFACGNRCLSIYVSIPWEGWLSNQPGDGEGGDACLIIPWWNGWLEGGKGLGGSWLFCLCLRRWLVEYPLGGGVVVQSSPGGMVVQTSPRGCDWLNIR